MQEVLYTFHRRWFRVWSYSIGHSNLLLRSEKLSSENSEQIGAFHSTEYAHPTRIDVLFKGVEAVLFRAMEFRGELVISQLHDPADPLHGTGLSWPPAVSGCRLYALDASEGRSLVIAGRVFSAEDHGGHAAPSALQ